MGLAHLFGLDDGGQRWLCRSCGRMVVVEASVAERDDGARANEGIPTCPECGSTDLQRLALL